MNDARPAALRGVAEGIAPRPPLVLIVGAGRSGTTLVQRLVDKAGCRVPPETHFFSLFFLPMLLKRRTFPLTGRAMIEEAEAYLGLDAHSGLSVDASDIVKQSRGWWEAPTDSSRASWLSWPGANIRMEKTPNHLHWWRPLTSRSPRAEVIAIVRDPRSVVSSNLRVPFGIAHLSRSQSDGLAISRRWRPDRLPSAMHVG